MERKVKVGLIQYQIKPDWAENVAKVEKLLELVKDGGADLAILPEMFICPYELDLFPRFAEPIPNGRTCEILSGWAANLNLHIVGGSLPERDERGNLYNTATLWDNQGNLLAAHRKIHLFDVDLPGGVSFHESALLTPGQKITVLEILGMRLGIAVCYDIRFPELFRLMALAGADFVALPGAFNNVSGPAHWELSLRGRAVENTIYIAGVSGLAPPDSSYQSWGHSMMVDPFGQVPLHLGQTEGFGVVEVDPERIKDIRARLPLLKQRRVDLYDLRLLKS
ncbi:MAG: carbon-nitrogen hydrolase family protein [Deltaproteobacteria bacterium]|nr:carbon-nitrogen hydrolase family protein [Deltaproteobacteria bacterium]MBW2052260.1 carbon-nitrogen hydrolase family protein [Deltaproteobacteria bacterium]MBW2323085.1 carbon-nitrogen hydrolase family protein [Deltaproteobacteria bacterium]